MFANFHENFSSIEFTYYDPHSQEEVDAEYIDEAYKFPEHLAITENSTCIERFRLKVVTVSIP